MDRAINLSRPFSEISYSSVLNKCYLTQVACYFPWDTLFSVEFPSVICLRLEDFEM